MCKPSNWCNNLVPLLLDEQRQARAVFLTATPREYLVAILRGGSSRIENVARTAHHLLRSIQGGPKLWDEVMRSSADPLDRGARLALVALHAHYRIFDAARAHECGATFSLDEITRRPVEVLGEVARALELDLAEHAIVAAIDAVGGGHSKQPGERFSLRDRQGLDRKVEEEHGEVIRDALAWAETALQR